MNQLDKPRSGLELHGASLVTQPRLQPNALRRKYAPAPRAFLCAALSGVLLWLAYFPVAWGWLGWVAIVPLLALVRMELTTRRLLLASWACGLLFYFLILQWIRVADSRMYATWISLALYCSLYMPVAIWLVRRLERRTAWPLVFIVPTVWTALEYVRAHALTGFAWYYLGHTQHDWLPVIQIADVAGAYGVTFVVAAVNALIFEWLYQVGAFRSFLRLTKPTAAASSAKLAFSTAMVVLAVIGTVAYGMWRIRSSEFAVGPRVALIQGNLDQRIKNEAAEADGDRAARQMVLHYAELCNQAAKHEPRPQLIVWPETAWPYMWIEAPQGQPNDDCRRMMDWVWGNWPTRHLIGMNSSIGEGTTRRLHNSAVLFTARDQVGGRYDKMHRVPFGEYVPFRESLPWMDRFAPYDFDYSIRPGTEFTQFNIDSARFGVLICYEDTDPNLARKYVEGNKKVDFLVNISNDGWFIGSAEHEEHLAICRFRAVESRRAVARAVNMGVSAIIDGDGRVLPPDGFPKSDPQRKLSRVWNVNCNHEERGSLPVAAWANLKQEEAVLVGNIPIDRRTSWYAAYGDWLPQGCWALLGIGLLWSFRRPNAEM